LAELAYVFGPDGLGWLASRQECADSLDVLGELNSPIHEATVMEFEYLKSKPVQTVDYCCRKDINSHLPLVFDCYLQTSGLCQYQLPSFQWAEVSVHGRPGTDQLGKHVRHQSIMVVRFAIQLPVNEATCKRVISTLETLFPRLSFTARDDRVIVELTTRFHKLWHKLQ
jgi:hypothetical protein